MKLITDYEMYLHIISRMNKINVVIIFKVKDQGHIVTAMGIGGRTCIMASQTR